MSTKINPTFLLKGIDPNKLIEEFRQGLYARTGVKKVKIPVSAAVTILAPTYGKTNHDPVFALKDRNNCSIIVATSNHVDYQVYTTNGVVPNGGRCQHCLHDFTEPAIGYPVAFREQNLLSEVEGKAVFRIVYNFWVEGKFCSFECALAYIQNAMARPGGYCDVTILESERLLKQLYTLMHPKAGLLLPAQDFRLLISNGGSMTREQWQENKHSYVRTERVLTIPAKVEYVRQNYGTSTSTY